MTTGPQAAELPENSARLNANGELEYADKDGNWKLYEDPAAFLSGDDPEPQWVEKVAAPDGGDEG